MLAQTTHISLLTRLGRPDDPPEYASAWAEFQVRYGELVRRFAMRRGLQAADCDDVLQDTLVALGQAMRPDGGFEYDPKRGKFRSYLLTVVSHVIFRRLRQNSPDGTLLKGGGELSLSNLPAPEPAMEQLWETEWRRYHLQRAMRTVEAEFNEADRTAFIQYALEGHDARQTADALGMTLDQVYQAKSRILKRLSAIIEEQVADEG